MAGVEEDSLAAGVFGKLSTLPLSFYLGLGGLVLLGGAPVYMNELTLLKLTGALFIATYAIAWDFQSGYTGYISFGHSLFVATGGYTSAIMTIHYGIDPFLTIPVAVLVSALAGAAIGVPTLRLRGPYFSLLTLAAPLIIFRIFIIFPDYFGGAVGLIGNPDLFAETVSNFYMAFAVFAGAICLLWVVTRLRFGMILTAIREDETALAASGINPATYKISSFVVSAAITGLAGSLYVLSLVGNATPSQLIALHINILIFIAAIAGGMGSITGPAIGGMALFFARDSLSQIGFQTPLIGKPLADAKLIIIYSIAALVLYYEPKGLVVWLLNRGREIRQAVEMRVLDRNKPT